MTFQEITMSLSRQRQFLHVYTFCQESLTIKQLKILSTNLNWDRFKKYFESKLNRKIVEYLKSNLCGLVPNLRPR